MEFKVTARKDGDSVDFELTAQDTKEALALAKAEARVLFDYKTGLEPTVAVRPIKEES